MAKVKIKELGKKIKLDATLQSIITGMTKHNPGYPEKSEEDQETSDMIQDKELQIHFFNHVRENFSKQEIISWYVLILKKYGGEKLFTKNAPQKFHIQFHLLTMLVEQDFGIKTTAMEQEVIADILR